MIWTISSANEEGERTFMDVKSREFFLDSMMTAHVYQGYLSAFWQKTERSDTLLATLDLGPKIESIKIYSSNLPIGYHMGDALGARTYSEYIEYTQNVLDKAEHEGYPFASISLDSVRRIDKVLSGKLRFEPGPLITWDSLEIQGDSRTALGYLQNLSLLKVGETFSQMDFEEASTIISRSPYFILDRNPELRFSQRQAQPIFHLKDRRVNRLDGIIGVLPNENERGAVLITGQLDLELYHLGGKGRDIELHWKRLNIQTQSLDLGYRESYLFGSPLSAMVEFNLLKQDSSFLSRNFKLSFDYSPRPNLALSFFTNREASDLISVINLEQLTELPDAADFRWNEYGLGVEWNTLDSPILPRIGWRLRANFSAGNKRIIQNTAIPEDIYNDIDLNTAQYSFGGQIERYIPVKPIWGMWINAQFGWIENENLLLNDLFRIGGLKSLRGFNENFFYARSFAYLNFEQRLFLEEGSYLIAFVDAGVIENPFILEKRDIPVSLGAGLNLNTGSGLFKFVLGMGTSNEQPFSLSYSRIHFGYVATF